MHATGMKMNDIEFPGALHDMVHKQDFARQIIGSSFVSPK
jgi:hypothetical protein